MPAITPLNDDTLLLVFKDAVLKSDGSPSSKDAPLNISRTCRHWRELVLANKHFWTHFKFKSSYYYDDSGLKPKLAYLWLQRSGDDVLDLQFDEGVNEKLLFSIFESQSRLGRLHLGRDCSRRAAKQAMTIRNIQNLKDLYLLQIPLFSDGSYTIRSQPITPKLTKLDLTFPRERNLNNYWAVIELLDRCPNLMELRLEFGFSAFTISAPETNEPERSFQPNSYEKLEKVSLSGDFPFMVKSWLQHITVPFLRSLAIDSDDGHLPAILTDVLERSQCGALVERERLDQSMEADFQWWRNLQQITLNVKKLHTPFLLSEVLTVGNDTGRFWPVLELFQTECFEN